MVKPTRQAIKKAAKLNQIVATAERFKKATRASEAKNAKARAALRKRIKDNEIALKRWGRVIRVGNNEVICSDKQLPVMVSPAHAKKAKRRHDSDCPLARAVRASLLAPHITDVYVGATTVKMKSALNPQLELKFLMDSELRKAVSTWDEPKNKKWPLKAGVYFLNKYPRSLRLGYSPDSDKPRKPRGPVLFKAAPKRHISLRTDISRAMALAASSPLKKTTKKA